MNLKKIQHVKLWMVMVVAVIFWTIGAGFFGDLAAKLKKNMLMMSSQKNLSKMPSRAWFKA